MARCVVVLAGLEDVTLERLFDDAVDMMRLLDGFTNAAFAVIVVLTTYTLSSDEEDTGTDVEISLARACVRPKPEVMMSPIARLDVSALKVD